MQVVTTAGHVDHGKSALVRALTGIEPDRWAEERRRGMTIDLGFAWTSLPSGERVAFVDVPGHERFVTNMLAGVGPVPAAMLVVAADEGWQQQTEEHLLALLALGVEQAVVAVTKTDLADAASTTAQVRDRLASTSLRDAVAVGVSAHDGSGLDALRAALDHLVRALPAPDATAPVRLWIDRAFTISGAGTVVTGTLPAGAIEVGDELALIDGDRLVKVRALQVHQERCEAVTAVSRVAVNLRGVDRDDVRRGMALITPGAWAVAAEVDAIVDDGELPAEVVVHVGSAALAARRRRLDERVSRLRFAAKLPLHLGDVLLLRDPASRRIARATVVDLDPPPVRRRGDGGKHAATLRWPRDADAEVDRLGVVAVQRLVEQGLLPRSTTGDWRVADWQLDRWRVAVRGAVGAEQTSVARRLGVPSDLLPTVVDGSREIAQPTSSAMRALLDRLDAAPWSAPDPTTVDPAELAAAARDGRIVRVAPGIYVRPDAPALATKALAELDQPFTVSEARQALGSSRRVVVPLLEHLDATRRTRRDRDGRRVVVRTEA